MKQHAWKSAIAAYLDFSVRERWAIVVLVVLIVAIRWVPDWLAPDQQVVLREDSLLLSQLVQQVNEPVLLTGMPARAAPYDDKSLKPEKRFPFNPNNMDAAGWVAMGVSPTLAERIGRYREKGGRFRQPEDLLKIYGMPAALASELLPYVRLPGPPRRGGSREYAPVGKQESSESRQPKKYARPAVMINTADSAAWEALPGIGPVLAARICRFREKLGGFHDVGQLLEVYGVTDTLLEKIQPMLVTSNLAWRRLAINQATVEEMADHPYIRWKLAKAIVAYRAAHGPFIELAELKDIHLVTSEIYAKLQFYCKIP